MILDRMLEKSGRDMFAGGERGGGWETALMVAEDGGVCSLEVDVAGRMSRV